ncbi:hypothetical protein J3U05_10915, partial [Gilliamella sp. B2737]
KQIIDRSWRHPPKPPVLPCLGDEFTKICGTIERIDIEQQQAFEFKNRKCIFLMRNFVKHTHTLIATA